MRKMFAYMMVLIMVMFAFAGCADSSSSPAPTVNATEPAAQPTAPAPTAGSSEEPVGTSDLSPGCYDDLEQAFIAFVCCEVGIPYFTTMNWGALDAARDFNVDLYFTGPALWDFSAQIPFLDAAMAMNPQGLILVPSDEAAMVAYVEQYMADGIPVICTDVALNEPVSVVDYDSSAYSGGREAALYMYEINGDGGVYLPVGTNAGSYVSEMRMSGFIDTMKEINPTSVMLDRVYPGSEAARAAQLVSAAITGNADLTGIFVSTSAPASGASSAVIEAGKQGKITIASFDADPQQVEDLRDGVYDVLIAQDPYHMGYDAVANLAKIIRGDLTLDDFPEDIIHYNMFAITRENMDTDQARKFMYIQDLSRVGY